MTGRTTALMLKSLLLRNWLVDVNWVVFIADESWVAFMVDGSWEEDTPFPIPKAHDVDPLKKSEKSEYISKHTPISTFIPQAA